MPVFGLYRPAAHGWHASCPSLLVTTPGSVSPLFPRGQGAQVIFELVVSWSLSLRPGSHKQLDTALLPPPVVLELSGHWIQLFAPSSLAYWPALQSVHLLEAKLLAYRPAAHSTQASGAARQLLSLYRPGGHGRHGEHVGAHVFPPSEDCGAADCGSGAGHPSGLGSYPSWLHSDSGRFTNPIKLVLLSGAPIKTAQKPAQHTTLPAVNVTPH